jgi:glycosyltransferase involved in cell wall biosynthesis
MDSFNVHINKQYGNNRVKTDIGAVMMVKNESKRIQVTLDSLVSYVDCLIVYDTGSTDDTVDIISKHCEKHCIDLHLIKGEFVNFEVSRNVGLEFADTVQTCSYLLLMDCNDELRGGDELLEETRKYKDVSHISAFMVSQEWYTGTHNRYRNIRLIKARAGWRYKGVVHEYLHNPVTSEIADTRISEKVVLYQDRTQDDDKSRKRFEKDKVLLLKEHETNPTDARTVFYLAQTYACLKDSENAFKYYSLRASMPGYEDERFHSLLKCGELSVGMKKNWYETLPWFIKAMEHSERVEPYIHVTHYYNNQGKYQLAYMFIRKACELPYPNTNLFVDLPSYDYKGWHLMGVCAYYNQQYQTGYDACKKAAVYSRTHKNVSQTLDADNLKFYEAKLKPETG